MSAMGDSPAMIDSALDTGNMEQKCSLETSIQILTLTLKLACGLGSDVIFLKVYVVVVCCVMVVIVMRHT